MRQILRIPTGKQFRKMVDDDHEWFIIADTRLKPIVTSRGKPDSIPQQIKERVYARLNKSLYKSGKTIRVYDLHTHPDRNIMIPSWVDIDANLYQQQFHNLNTTNIKVVGYGVVGKREIVILKLPQSNTRLEALYNNVSRKYEKATKQNVAKRLHVKSWDDAVEKVELEKMDMKTQQRIMELEHKRALQQTVANSKEIKVKTLHRSRRINIRRLR